jgi:hypothetical protein
MFISIIGLVLENVGTIMEDFQLDFCKKIVESILQEINELFPVLKIYIRRYLEKSKLELLEEIM